MWTTVSCPYCGERYETAVDADNTGSTTYVEDCAICCRPIMFHVCLEDDGTLNVATRRDDE